jgi:pimeloyl-ACP methyl ester carboxylesterase
MSTFLDPYSVARVFAAALFALCVGIFVYVAGSFFLMRPHVGARGRGQWLREMLREALWSLRTQPFLPWYYGFGSRLAKGDKTPVVVVHGYMQNRVSFIAISRALNRRGLGPVYGFNYPWYRSVAHNSALLGAFVERLCAATKQERVILVCHSMGGLIAVHYILHGAGKDRVQRCVTIASPHAGVLYRGPVIGAPSRDLRKGSELLLSIQGALPIPVLSIASTHDNVVHPASQSSIETRGGVDFVIEGPGHLSILFDRRVLDRVADFVAEGA